MFPLQTSAPNYGDDIAKILTMQAIKWGWKI